jgi:hypothetical protein
LFLKITRACQGVLFHTAEIAKQFMGKAKISTRLDTVNLR